MAALSQDQVSEVSRREVSLHCVLPGATGSHLGCRNRTWQTEAWVLEGAQAGVSGPEDHDVEFRDLPVLERMARGVLVTTN